MTLHEIVRKTSLLTASEMSVSALLSYIIAIKVANILHFSNPVISGLWAGISAVVVMEVNIKDVKYAGYMRLLGSLFGGICSAIVAMLLGYNLMSIVVTMFVTTIVVSLFNFKQTLRLSNLTALIIIVVGILDPSVSPWSNAIARVLESLLGVVITTMLVCICYPIRKKFDLFKRD
jgi:uncharacterized membrane protein YgaE (UPF0421/DUF939 family)